MIAVATIVLAAALLARPQQAARGDRREIVISRVADATAIARRKPVIVVTGFGAGASRRR
jgi:hypothetical protein